ncbi:MAG: hypothetical protein ABF535_01665 [Acetobacter sp.]
MPAPAEVQPAPNPERVLEKTRTGDCHGCFAWRPQWLVPSAVGSPAVAARGGRPQAGH